MARFQLLEKGAGAGGVVLTPRLPCPARDLGLSISGPQFPRCIIAGMGDRVDPLGSDLFGCISKGVGRRDGKRALGLSHVFLLNTAITETT